MPRLALAPSVLVLVLEDKEAPREPKKEEMCDAMLL